MWLQDSLAYNPDGGLGGHTPGPQFYDHLFGSGRFDRWANGWRARLRRRAHQQHRLYAVLRHFLSSTGW